MAVKVLMKSGHLSALAMALAALALPTLAHAQRFEGRSEARSADRIEARADARMERAQRMERPARAEAPSGGWTARSQAQAAPQAAPAAPPQARWNGGSQGQGDGGSSRNRGWRGGGNAPTVAAPAQAQAQAADGQRSRHVYGDANRGWRGTTPPAANGAAPPQRGSWQDGRRRDDARDRRDGNRDGNRNGWRDGRRDGQRDNSWSGNTGWSNNSGYRNGNSRYDGNRGNYGQNHRRWDNRSWRRDNRYDWNSYRTHNRDIFRLGSYYSPYRNYSYRRLSIGFFLDSLFFNDRYWINDPWQYRLPAVYGSYRWVRYYDDVLLVDVYTGEVVDTIYGFFW